MTKPRFTTVKNEVTEMKRLFNRYVPMNNLAPVTRKYFFNYVK